LVSKGPKGTPIYHRHQFCTNSARCAYISCYNSTRCMCLARKLLLNYTHDSGNTSTEQNRFTYTSCDYMDIRCVYVCVCVYGYIYIYIYIHVCVCMLYVYVCAYMLSRPNLLCCRAWQLRYRRLPSTVLIRMFRFRHDGEAN